MLILIDFMGHRMSSARSVSLRSNVHDIGEFPKPVMAMSLQEFWECYFYHRFISNAAKYSIISALYPEEKYHKPKSSPGLLIGDD